MFSEAAQWRADAVALAPASKRLADARYAAYRALAFVSDRDTLLPHASACIERALADVDAIVAAAGVALHIDTQREMLALKYRAVTVRERHERALALEAEIRWADVHWDAAQVAAQRGLFKMLQ